MFASFVRPQDTTPLALALSLYEQPLSQLNGFELVDKTYRVGCWVNGTVCIIGCRGTSIGGPEFMKDINDDRILAGLSKYGVCDLSIVKEAQDLIRKHRLDLYTLIFCGHSLGGRAALCLCNMYPNSTCVMFNAGAPPTNPVTNGPGPNRAIHYHIFGDAISSHMGPAVAQIIRIRKPGTPTWGYAYPHETQRIMVNDGAWVFATVDEEQEDWMKHGDQRNGIGRFWTRQATCNTPIPGSTVRCSLWNRINVLGIGSISNPTLQGVNNTQLTSI